VNSLNSLGFSVAVADGAVDTLDLLDRLQPDLVILDDRVKGLTPDRFLDELQRRDLDTFAVITTRENNLDRGMDWIISGAFALLRKPLNLDRLKSVIEKGLENKEAYHYVVTMAQELKKANDALEREKTALKEKTDQMRFLYEIGAALSTTLDGREIVNLVSREVLRLVKPDLVTFLTTFSPETGLKLYLDRCLDDHVTDYISRTLTERLNPPLAIPPLVCGPKTPPRPRPAPDGHPAHHFTLPLVAAGSECGLMGLFFFQPPELDTDRLMLLKSIALQSAQALFNAHQHECALNMAAHDSLTGLLNRRAFNENLTREFERSQRYGNDMSLIMIDLDHFKSVNDRFGHDAGDEVLRKVAESIREGVRSTDIAARFGGEEFAVILPNTNHDEALRLAQRIQQDIQGIDIDLGSVMLKQTVSQGLASTHHVTINQPEDLMRLADQAMYMAKKSGRNTIRRAVDLEIFETRKDDLHACQG
jgi:diguanylate cyclase (GGDEF)-like protein